MRRYPFALLLSMVALAACSHTSPTPLDPAGSATDLEALIATSLTSGANLLALVDVVADPATGDLALLPPRTGARPQDRYQLPIDGFLRPQDFRLLGIERSADTVVLTVRLQHPFAAPTSLSSPATAANRADLGVVPRIVVLDDLATGANVADFTYFGSTIARPEVLATADGYCDIGDLLPANAARTTTIHPFQMAIDELVDGIGNRVGIASGSSTGNYNAGSGGWTAANIGATRDRWTGYQMLHQGQAAVLDLALTTAMLTDPGDAPLQLAVLAEYLDPRGGTTSAEKRANRLPATPNDVAKFVYRMPHGAADLSRTTFLEQTGTLEAGNAASVATVHWRVTDLDARATASTFTPLSDDPQPNTVVAGAEGVPVAMFDAPSITASPVTLVVTNDDTAYGGDADAESGLFEDPLYVTGSLTNNAATGAQTAGDYWGLIELIDPEDSLDRSGYEFPVDGALQPVATGLAKRSWQFASLTVEPVVVGCALQTHTFSFNTGPEGWTPWGTNSDANDWSHFRHGCPNSVSEANAPGVLSPGGAYWSMGDDNDNLSCEFDVDYGPNAAAGLRSPLMTIPTICTPNTLQVEFNAYLFAAAGAVAEAFVSADSADPGTPVWTQVATGEEQLFANQVLNLPDTFSNGPLRIWFRFTGGPTLYETTTGELAGLAIDNVAVRVEGDAPILTSYTPPVQPCGSQDLIFDFDDAAGWQGGQFFGLPNGDAQATLRTGLGGAGSFRWTECDASTDPTGTYGSVISSSFGAIVGRSLNVSADQDLMDGGVGTGCAYVDDFGGNAAYNIVSPAFLIPTICGGGDEVSFRWNAYLNSNAIGGLEPSALKLYISTDNGASWGSAVWTLNASGGGTAALNQLVYVDSYPGQTLRFRFEFTTNAGSVRQSATLGQPFGCYVDHVRLFTNSATTPIVMP